MTVNSETPTRGKGPLFRPMPGWLTVAPRPQKSVSDSGLYVPPNATRRDILGVVIAKGAAIIDNDGKNYDPDFRPGDVVVCSRHAGSGWENPKSDVIELMFYRFTDVIAVVAHEKDLNRNSLDTKLSLPVRAKDVIEAVQKHYDES